MKKITNLLILICFVFNSHAFAEFQNEVFPETDSKVLVRVHPKTGEEYVSIIPDQEPPPDDPLFDGRGKYSRPDYRYLDHKVKKGSVAYDGPYSSKTKVYILAASLATIGVVGAATLPVAATTGAAAGSAVGPGIGAAATGAGVAAATIKLQPKDIPDDYQRLQESQLLEAETDFYRMHILKEGDALSS